MSNPHPSTQTQSLTSFVLPRIQCTSRIAALSPGLIIASHCLSLPAFFSSYPYPGPVPGRVKARGRTPRLCFLPQVCPALGLVLGGIFRNGETHCCLQGPGLCMRCRQLTIRQGRDCTVCRVELWGASLAMDPLSELQDDLTLDDPSQALNHENVFAFLHHG